MEKYANRGGCGGDQRIVFTGESAPVALCVTLTDSGTGAPVLLVKKELDFFVKR